MLEWTLRTLRLTRELRELALQAQQAYDEGNEAALQVLKPQAIRVANSLQRELPDQFPASRIGDLRRHAGYGMRGDYDDILRHDLPDIEDKIDQYARVAVPERAEVGFEHMLHPLVRRAAMGHYQDGDFRNAVLDAITAVFDKLRQRTDLDLDGDRLVSRALSVHEPLLILSELDTESGRSDQTGFMDIFKGFYRGVRNPKAHSLVHDLDAIKAAQHLVLASILMRRVVEARDVA